MTQTTANDIAPLIGQEHLAGVLFLDGWVAAQSKTPCCLTKRCSRAA